jgi:hypothetical protein
MWNGVLSILEALMDRIEAVELLNTHFFTDTTQCREAWYTIRAALQRSGNSDYAAALWVYNEYCRERFSPYRQPPSFYDWLKHRLHSEEPNAPQNS